MSVRLKNLCMGSSHVVLSHDRLRSKIYYISIENEAIEFVRKSHFRYLQRVILSVAPFANVRTTQKIWIWSVHVVLSHDRVRSRLYYISIENEAIEFLRKSDVHISYIKEIKENQGLRLRIQNIRFREKKKWNLKNSKSEPFDVWTIQKQSFSQNKAVA